MPRSWSRAPALVIASLALATACHDSTGPKVQPGPTSGHWVGSPSVYLPMDFTMTQTDTIITGTGTITALDGTVEPMSVIGFVPTIPDSTPVVVTFSVENIVPGVFAGALSPDGKTMSGTFFVAFTGTQDTVTFTRK